MSTRESKPHYRTCSACGFRTPAPISSQNGDLCFRCWARRRLKSGFYGMGKNAHSRIATNPRFLTAPQLLNRLRS